MKTFRAMSCAIHRCANFTDVLNRTCVCPEINCSTEWLLQSKLDITHQRGCPKIIFGSGSLRRDQPCSSVGQPILILSVQLPDRDTYLPLFGEERAWCESVSRMIELRHHQGSISDRTTHRSRSAGCANCSCART